MTHTLLTATKRGAALMRTATLRSLVLIGGLVILSACGGVAESDATATVNTPSVDAPDQTVRFEEPRVPGDDPFTVSVVVAKKPPAPHPDRRNTR